MNKIWNKISCLENVEMKNYSTIKIGGRAKYMVFPCNFLELKRVVEISNENNLKYFVLGNGSNVLFSDNGFDGVIINLKYFDKFKVYDNDIRVGAGVNLFKLNQILCENGLSGLEWSYGIPGTVGGAVVMNAGSFGGEICDYLVDVVYFENGKIYRKMKDEIDFSYRYSSFQEKKCCILSVKFKLNKEDKTTIEKNMNGFLNKKKESQPYNLPSLGSVFKIIQKTEKIYPAKLIDNLGLKGVKIGGAEISKKHAGFIVNSGGATASDVVKLIELVEKKLAEIDVFPEKEIIIL